jgi:hypothetical protein
MSIGDVSSKGKELVSAPANGKRVAMAEFFLRRQRPFFETRSCLRPEKALN